MAAARAGLAIAAPGDWVLLQAEAWLGLARALAASGDVAAATLEAQHALELSRAKGAAGAIATTETFLRSIAVARG